MKKTTTLLFALCLGIINIHAQNYQWAKSMGGTDWDQGNSIAVDGSGNVYTTGYFYGTVDFDPGAGISNLTSAGTEDIFISKLDAAGKLLWAKSMGGASSDVGNSITIDGSGNVYTTGYFQGTVDFDPSAGTSNLTSAGVEDIFISKLDAAGNFIWAKRMGGANDDLGYSIAMDGNGNVYTTGYFWGTADFDPGAGISNLRSAGINDIFISKLDAAGNYIWAKRMGGTNRDLGYSIAVDDFGNIYTTGLFFGIADFDPGVGTSNLTTVGSEDIFISKLDASGNFLWAKSIGGAVGWDVGRAITVDGSGNVYTTGGFQQTVDFDPGAGTSNLKSAGYIDVFILKLDVSGNFLWAKNLGGTDYDEGYSIAVDSRGNVYTTGYFYGTADYDPGAGTSNLKSAGVEDIFISKLDAAGNFLWAESMGGTETDLSYSIDVDDYGNLYTTGGFFGTADFAPGVGISNLTSAGSSDIFILKLEAGTITSLENSLENTLRAYPNPTNGTTSIDLGTSYENVTVVVRNQLGQEVLKKSYSAANSVQVNIPGEAGMYFIEVSSGDKKAMLKVAKE